MPPASTIKTFLKALRTGRTHFTEVLDGIFTSPGNLPGLYPGEYHEFSQPHALDTPLRQTSPLVAAFLLSQGMSSQEIDHMDKWPDTVKEQVRVALDNNAIKTNTPFKFFWELYDGAASDAVIGANTISFRSPRAGLDVSAVTFGDVSVQV